MPTLNYIVLDDTATVDTHADFTYTTTPSSHQLCGAFTYTATYSSAETPLPLANNDPLAYNASTRTLTVLTDDTNLIGETRVYEITAEFTSYPSTVSSSSSGSIIFSDPCDDPFTFAATAQNDVGPYAYSGDAVFTLTDFTIDPPLCDVTYACTGVARADGQAPADVACDSFTGGAAIGPAGTLTLTATPGEYTAGDVRPGAYVVTITGTSEDVDGNAIETQTATFTLTIRDPCYPPSSIASGGLTDQTYVLTTDGDLYTHNEFTIVPAYCGLTYSYSVTKLSDGTSDAVVLPSD